MTNGINQEIVLVSYRDNDVEAIVVKNGALQLYKVTKMDFDEVKDFLTNLNTGTLKI